MRKTIRFALATAIVLGTAVAANAQSVMKQCGEQWQAAKAAGTTNGETWPQFLAQCRAQLSSGAATAAPTPAPTTQPQSGSLFPWQTPAAPAPAASPAASNQSVMKQCGAQWQAAKAGWDYKRRNLATVPESVPSPACLNDERSAAGGICASNASASSCAFARADTCVAAGSSVSLSRINCRLGQ